MIQKKQPIKYPILHHTLHLKFNRFQLICFSLKIHKKKVKFGLSHRVIRKLRNTKIGEGEGCTKRYHQSIIFFIYLITPGSE